MNPILAITVIFFVYAIGDIIAAKTKAVFSMMIVGAIVFMVAFWCGLPKTIFADSTLLTITSFAVPMFLVHIGTTIKPSEFVAQWKTVVLVLFTTIAICLGVYFIGKIFMDKYYALVSAPIVGGGFVAYSIMSGLGKVLKRNDILVFAVLVLTFQSFIGMPIASLLCKKEALRLRDDIRGGKLKGAKDNKESGTTAKKLIPQISPKYDGPNLILFKVALIALASALLAQVTGVNVLIFCLILGVAATSLGLLEENALIKANAFGLVIAAALATVFASLANTNPAQVLSMLPQILIVLVIGVACCALIGIPLGKLLNYSWYMSFALALTALFGFPATYLISKEVCTAAGETEEEVQIITENIMPKMIISGIVSVSVVSGLVAGVMVNWL